MKRKSLFITVLLTLFTNTVLTFAAQLGNEFIGYRHSGVVRGETLPNGVRDLGGGLLSDENYGVTRFVQGKKYMLWFEKMVDRNAAGIPDWEVKDVLTFEKAKNQEFLFSYSSPCLQNRKINFDLIVLAERLPRQKFYKVLKAWHANVRNERFEEISTEAIICKFNQ